MSEDKMIEHIERLLNIPKECGAFAQIRDYIRQGFSADEIIERIQQDFCLPTKRPQMSKLETDQEIILRQEAYKFGLQVGYEMALLDGIKLFKEKIVTQDGVAENLVWAIRQLEALKDGE